jgi:hypothetical protein
VQQILERVVRRLPILGRPNLLSGFGHQTRVGLMRRPHQRIDRGLSLLGVQLGVVFQNCYFPLSAVHVIADFRLGFH